jgi:pectinesterase
MKTIYKQFSTWLTTAIYCGILLLIVFPVLPSWGVYSDKTDDWYRSEEAQQIADNILSWQSPHGSWPKNINTERRPYTDDPNKLEGTFDNGATTGEMRFLARAFNATSDHRYQQAFIKGLDHILKAQYPSGGWPQYYPPGTGYPRYITFNDEAMVRLMNLLREVAESTDYGFVDTNRRKAAGIAFERGIECILKCQIRVNGKLTVWCAQHDEVDYEPRPGRTYELVSLSGKESANILQLLMSLENPGTRVINSVKSAVAWYESAKITGIRQKWNSGDKIIVKDPNAPPLWARFYEIETNKPIFSGRDGVKKYDMAEIEAERRNGYNWYGRWGETVAKRYKEWISNLKTPNVEAEGDKEDSELTIFGFGSLDRIIVAPNGSGQFKSVQDAVNSVPESNTKHVKIFIKPGIYKEHIVVPHDRRFVSFIGEDAEKTILTYNLNAKSAGNDGKPIGTFRSASTVIAADYFTAENITFGNSFGPGVQALAINIIGDCAVFRKCRFLGWQDTILTQAGRHYFEDCYITGHVDFIFGGATAFFQNCHIHCLGNGFITAASTPENQPFGYVFSNCKITADAAVKRIYLGRPWRPFASVTFIETQMPQQIDPAGWNNWRDSNREKTARFSEYGSTGPRANSEKRVKWSKQLSKAEAAQYTIENVLGGADSWNPREQEGKEEK